MPTSFLKCTAVWHTGNLSFYDFLVEYMQLYRKVIICKYQMNFEIKLTLTEYANLFGINPQSIRNNINLLKGNSPYWNLGLHKVSGRYFFLFYNQDHFSKLHSYQNQAEIKRQLEAKTKSAVNSAKTTNLQIKSVAKMQIKENVKQNDPFGLIAKSKEVRRYI